MRRCATCVLFAMLSTLACGGTGGPTELTPSAAEADPVEPAILERPFTAEQIRDEWVEGLILMVRRSDPEGTSFERWTVVSADNEGADIEYVTTDNSGNALEDPRVERSTWVELRDHASFPAANSTREWVSRSTQIGDLDGWLYQVSVPDSGAVQEFFFAEKAPGAPVQMRIFKDEETVFELEQFMRMRPATK